MNKFWKFIVVMTLFSIVGMVIYAVENPNPPNFEHLQNVNRTDGIVDYGSGVYHFPQIGASFASALADFLKVHKDVEVTAMTPALEQKLKRVIIDGRYTSSMDLPHSVAVGYFVTFREKGGK